VPLEELARLDSRLEHTDREVLVIDRALGAVLPAASTARQPRARYGKEVDELVLLRRGERLDVGLGGEGVEACLAREGEVGSVVGEEEERGVRGLAARGGRRCRGLLTLVGGSAGREDGRVVGREVADG